MSQDSLQDSLEALRDGRIVVLLDDAARVSRGVMVAAADASTPEIVNVMATEARGVICVGMGDTDCERLGLRVVPEHENEHSGQFTQSVEAAVGVTTGISAADRSATLIGLADPSLGPDSLVSPGHIFPVLTHTKGVLGRATEAEAAVDLVRLAGRAPAVAAYCHVLGEAGNMATSQELESLAEEKGYPFVRMSELIRYRIDREFFVHLQSQGTVETMSGTFDAHVFENELDGVNHLVLTLGDLTAGAPNGGAPLVRVHSQCLTGDVFQSLRCDCGDQLEAALARIAAEGVGAVVYLRQEGRGIGLVNKIRAYSLQDGGRDTVDANLELGFEADQRSFVVAAQILKSLGVRSIRLMTNNPRKVRDMQHFGVEVAERVAVKPALRPENERYLRAKAERLGHLLDFSAPS